METGHRGAPTVVVGVAVQCRSLGATLQEVARPGQFLDPGASTGCWSHASIRAPISVSIVLPGAADVSVYLATERSLDGATKLGSKADAKGTVTFAVPEGTQGQYVIVWFTALTQEGNDSRYRARLAEITIEG